MSMDGAAACHADDWRSPVHYPRLWFDRGFFERRGIGDYDGIVWRLYWPPESEHRGAPFSSPTRLGVHLCGCLLHYVCCDMHPDTIWRLGPFVFNPDRIAGQWPD